MTIKVFYNKKGKRYSWPVEVSNTGSQYIFEFDYNEIVKDEIKALAGARWNPDKRVWTATICTRNAIALEILQGDYSIYEWYAQKPEGTIEIPEGIEAFKHQEDGARHICTKKRVLIAGDAGIGKTLLTLIALYNTDCKIPYLVAPHSALQQWKRELIKWGFHRKYPWRWSTYEGLDKTLKSIKLGVIPVPDFLILDESVKIKTPNAKRSKQTFELAELVREQNGHIVELSGIIAPRNPCDWWNQIETLCPGYIREGDQKKLGYRLGIYQKTGEYYKNVGWDEDELQAFAKRISPVVHVIKKSDVFDFPDKIFDPIELPVSDEYKKLARFLTNHEPSGAVLLGRLRELSDGFSYDPEGKLVSLPNSPKELLLKELLDFYNDAKRIVISAAFIESLNKCVKVADNLGWEVGESHGRTRIDTTFLDKFASDTDDRLAAVVHPGCVYGLNFSASPAILVYSNDFNVDSRGQLLERCDRPGKTGAGTRIVDFLHLPSDKKVLDTITANRNVYNFTVDQIKEWMV